MAEETRVKGLGCAAIVAAMMLAGCDRAPSSLDEAAAAYAQGRVAAAEGYFRTVAAERGATPGDRARAHRWLGRIAWLVDADAPRAVREADAALATGEDRCAAAGLKARILGEAHRTAALKVVLPALLAACPDAGDGDGIREHLARALLTSDAPATEVGTVLATLDPIEASGPEASALRLWAAVAGRDAAAALQAWKDYFWLADTDLPPALRARFDTAAPIFAAALIPSPDPAASLRLVDLLIRAGFADAAARYAADAGLAQSATRDPAWRRASAYFSERRALVALIERSNRRVARGGAADDLGGAVAQALARLAAAVGSPGKPADVVYRAYGLYGQTGDTGGFRSVHFGHVVDAQQRTIVQYGHRAQVRFLSLDNMLANGFETWLWDGDAAAGGWTAPGPTIVQVRSEYLSGPASAWHLVAGGPALQRLERKRAEREAADRAALATSDVAYLPGLADRLRLKVARQIAAEARRAGGDPRRAFLAAYERAAFDQSILAHEGRHAIDRAAVGWLGRLSDANLEYRAKLSELALARYPALALLNIDDRTIGGDSGHGKANARIMRALATWVAAHPKKVAGHDAHQPAMTQLDRLTDAQLRRIGLELEPFLH